MNPLFRRIIPLALGLALPGNPLQAESARSGADNAREQLKQMKVADGLAVSLFAMEPMVVNPTDLDIDFRGRIWVTEGANYRSSFQKWGVLRPDGDRIQILTDTDGDGTADQARTFYQDPSINAALGICVLGNRVFVSASPYIFVLTDTDGDDAADKRELLFVTDPKQADHDHAAHAFTFGPDGKLYFNFGNAGGFLRHPPGGRRDLPLHGRIEKDELLKGEVVRDIDGRSIAANGKPFRQGMAFRCNLDGSAVEVLGHNFRNNYEVAVDSFGTVWQPDNDDDGNKGVRINYVMEGGNFGYTDEMTGAGWGQKRTGWESEIPRRHWHLNDPGVVPNLLLTGAGSPTGIAMYEGTLLPVGFRNQMIHCDAGPRVVRAYPVSVDGAGYKAEMLDLITSEDSWFRPSDVAVAPDGSVYVADWNDAGVGGHFMKDQELATMTGRIYRIAPPGHKPGAPATDLKSAKGALAALNSPNSATRYLGWTALSELGDKAGSVLARQWNSKNPRERARVLPLLARLKGHEAKVIRAGLKDPVPDIRIATLRTIRQRHGDVMAAASKLASDKDASVRREVALTLRSQSASAGMPALWAQLAARHDGSDRWYLEALGIGAERSWDACLGAFLAAHPKAATTSGGRDIIWRSRAKASAGLLVNILSDKTLPETEKARYLRAFDFLTGPEKDEALLKLLTTGNP